MRELPRDGVMNNFNILQIMDFQILGFHKEQLYRLVEEELFIDGKFKIFNFSFKSCNTILL